MPISTDARSLRAQEDGSIKTDFSINQEIKGRKRSWHDFELNALTCEVSTTQAPTDEGASSEQHVLVDIDLKTQKPLSFVIGENGTTIRFKIGGGCNIGGDYWNPLVSDSG